MYGLRTSMVKKIDIFEVSIVHKVRRKKTAVRFLLFKSSSIWLSPAEPLICMFYFFSDWVIEIGKDD